MADNTSIHFGLQITGISSTLMVAKFEATEAMSSLFSVDVVFGSDDKEISFSDAIGKPTALSMQLEKDDPRFIHGIVSRIRHLEDGQKFSFYRMTIVPKLWKLTHRHDTRIFQEKSVPDIIKAVLSGGGVSDMKMSLSGSYSPREYCVQYRESDFAFVSRLMEEEGIFYFFEHAEDKHTMVIGDAPGATSPIAGVDTLHYKTQHGAISMGESVSRFSSSEEVRPGKVSLTDYNFEKPTLSLAASTSGQLDTDLEIYDYPGEYDLPGDGSNYAKVRLEEWQVARTVVEGDSSCMRFTPGYKFTLADHPRSSDNGTYLLTAVRHHAAQPHVMDSAASDKGFTYSNSFHGVPEATHFRPERKTPRPTIKGIQTAIVTGPGGQEIHTDQHGRVKVHFHWDRVGKKDETSSCWIRVSQLWAGGGWGAMWIPRIGHEVVVDFVEGDPDRPLIVGRVYHGANVPPYALPGEKTKSTIKSNSSPGGGGSNELRFEDKKGSEEIYLHGQKDWNIKIEHDKNQLVGHDETKKVEHDETYEIGNDQTLTVDHDRKKEVKHDQEEKIGNDKTITVGGHHSETISKTETLTVLMARSVNVGGAHAESIAGVQSVEIGMAQSIQVGGGQSTAMGGSHSLSVGGASSENITKQKSIETGAEYTLTVAKDMTVTVKKSMKDEAGEERTIIVAKKLAINVGDASILLEKDGKVTVQGKDITVKGSGAIKVDGKSIDLKTDGAVNLEASGKVTIKGSQVGVN